MPAFSEFAGDKQFATTLARGLELLRCFSSDQPILGNKDLARMTGLPKPTVSRLTYTLTHLGYLQVNHRFGKYQLGAAVLALGHPLLATTALRQIARPSMKQFAEYAQGSVSMGVRDRFNIVYIETSRSSSIFSQQLSDIGLSQPLVATAIGRAYLAACTPDAREALLNRVKVGCPDMWKRHERSTLESIEAFGRFGFCISYGDLRPEIHAVGVPYRPLVSGEIIAFNCVLRANLLKPGQLQEDIGPRLAAMVASLNAS